MFCVLTKWGKEYHKSVKRDMRLLQMCSEEMEERISQSVESDMRLFQLGSEAMGERISQKY